MRRLVGADDFSGGKRRGVLRFRPTFGAIVAGLTATVIKGGEARLALEGSGAGSFADVNDAEQLCLACGLCCDGTLFGHVRLLADEDGKKLRALGLPIAVSRGAAPVARFPQPCVALCADRTCRVYAGRPSQCRSFECGVFKGVQAGRDDFGAALRLVKKARRLADRIRVLLREMGDTDERVALSERFRRMQVRMESGRVDAASGERFAELGVAMHRLNLLTHEKFYTKPESQREVQVAPSP